MAPRLLPVQVHVHSRRAPRCPAGPLQLPGVSCLLASPTLLISCHTILQLIPLFLVPREQGSCRRRTPAAPCLGPSPGPSLLLCPGSLQASPASESSLKAGSFPPRKNAAAASPTWSEAALGPTALPAPPLPSSSRLPSAPPHAFLSPTPVGPLPMTFVLLNPRASCHFSSSPACQRQCPQCPCESVPFLP